MCQFVEGVHTTLPYALAVFLVRSMLKGEGGSGGEAGQIPPPPPSERAVGWTTGALAACWSLAQFATSMLWGRVSDAGLGRRPQRQEVADAQRPGPDLHQPLWHA